MHDKDEICESERRRTEKEYLSKHEATKKATDQKEEEITNYYVNSY